MKSPDWFAIITELIYAGVSMKELGRLMDAQLSESMLRYYRAGGEPPFFRGWPLLLFWMHRCDHSIDEIPWRDVMRGHRAHSDDEMTLHQSCSQCGQKMRGRVLDKWRQLQIHYEEFGRSSSEQRSV